MKKYLVVFEKTETGYSAYVPDLEGCVATGSTKDVAKQNIYEAIRLHIEGMEEEGLSIPAGRADSEVLVFN